MSMRLKVLLPAQILLDQDVGKVVAEAENGSFGMLPRHIDFVAALPPGILSYTLANEGEKFIGIDEGILVKQEKEVLVSVRNAVLGDDLSTLRDIVRETFIELDERERSGRSALARLEAGLVRRFMELEERR